MPELIEPTGRLHASWLEARAEWGPGIHEAYCERTTGLATWALGRMVGRARVLGMERLLVVCEAGNAASARTIERHGGLLEYDAGHGPVLRNWIRTDR